MLLDGLLSEVDATCGATRQVVREPSFREHLLADTARSTLF
jgi:hypothetical protein